MFKHFEDISDKIQQNLSDLNQLLQQRKVAKPLSKQILLYLQAKWQYENQIPLKLKKFLNELNSSLRTNIQSELHLQFMKNITFFQKYFSDELIIELCKKVKEKLYLPDEVIVSPKYQDQHCLYILFKGQVSFFHGKNSLYTLDQVQFNDFDKQINQQGNYFGEVNFFSGTTGPFTVKSNDFTVVISLKREEFLHILKEFPKDYVKKGLYNNFYYQEIFCMIRDQIMIQNDHSMLGTACFSCGSIQHSIIKCPYLHYEVNKLHLISKYEFSCSQNRDRNFISRRFLHKKQPHYIRKNINHESIAESLYTEDEKNQQQQRTNLQDSILTQKKDILYQDNNNEIDEDLIQAERANSCNDVPYLPLRFSAGQIENEPISKSDQNLELFFKNYDNINGSIIQNNAGNTGNTGKTLSREFKTRSQNQSDKQRIIQQNSETKKLLQEMSSCQSQSFKKNESTGQSGRSSTNLQIGTFSRSQSKMTINSYQKKLIQLIYQLQHQINQLQNPDQQQQQQQQQQQKNNIAKQSIDDNLIIFDIFSKQQKIELESIKNFDNYMPKDNAEKVVNKYNEKIIKK